MINLSCSKEEKCVCGTLYVHIGHDNKRVKEVRCNLGKEGSCPRVLCGVITGLMNILFNMGVNVEGIIKELEGHSCGRTTKRGNGVTTSCADGIAYALKEFKVELMTMPPETKPNPKL